VSDQVGAKILLIDDDPSLPGMVRQALEQVGHELRTAGDGLEGLKALYQWRPDLVILDITMPRMDGWETCERIREVADIPIMMLTGMTGAGNEMRGLRDGADLYMTKPFALSVLVARVEALLRRSHMATAGPRQTVISIGDLQLDLAKHSATQAGKPIDLSPTEYRLLKALASTPGQVVSHHELLTTVWGPEYADQDSYLKLYIHYLRQKIEKDPTRPEYLVTRRGVGYYLCDPHWEEEQPQPQVHFSK